MMNLQPITLAGRAMRLEPLGYEHAADLLEAAGHDGIWTYLDEPTPRTFSMIEAFIRDALEDLERGVRLPFAIIDQRTETAVGSTSYIAFGRATEV